MSLESVIEEVVDEINKSYSEFPKVKEWITNKIKKLSKSTGDLERVKFVTKMYLDEEVKKAIIEYSKTPIVWEWIAWKVGSTAEYTENPEKVRFIAKVYMDKDVMRAIEAYSDTPEIEERIVWEIGYMSKFGDLNSIKLAAETIRAYKEVPAIGKRVMVRIREATELKGSEKVNIISKIFSNKKLTKKILYGINTEELVKYGEYILKNGEDAVDRIIISRYTDLNPTDEHFYEKFENLMMYYGIETKLTVREFVNFFESYENLGKEERDSFGKLIDLISNDYWNNKEIRKITEEMERKGINVDGLKGKYWIRELNGFEINEINIEYTELVESLLISLLGSKDTERYKAAYNLIKEIGGKEKLRKAQNLIKGDKRLRGKLIEAYKTGNLDEILIILENICKGKKKDSYDALHDLVDYVKGYKDRLFKGNYIIGFYGKSIDAIFRNDTTMCCALLPDGANRYGAILYQLDPRIITIGYAFVDEIKKGEEMDIVREKGEIDGIVIGYIGEYDGKPILLIDSVEGGRKFRNYLEKNWEKIYRDINAVAEKIGMKYVLLFEDLKVEYNNGRLEINGNPLNETPREFIIQYINKNVVNLDKKEELIKHIDIKVIGRKEIPYDYVRGGKHYLEAFGGWNVPEGKVRGYLYEV